MDRCKTIRLGAVDYDTALNIQLDERRKVLEGESRGTIYLLEHTPPVITLGRSAHKENLLVSEEVLCERGYQLRTTGRGGDITAHEPGQVVAYFIVPVPSKSSGPFVDSIVKILLNYLNDAYSLQCSYSEDQPGLWVSGKKICSLGFDLTGGASMHGIALNVKNTLEGFSYIVPCGLRGVPMTTLSRESAMKISIDKVFEDLANVFAGFSQ